MIKSSKQRSFEFKGNTLYLSRREGIKKGGGEKRMICHKILSLCAMPYALCVLLNTDGKFDEEGGALGFVVPYPDISVVIGNDGVDNSQP